MRDMIAKGVKRIPKPQYIQVILPSSRFRKCSLNVVYKDNSSAILPISKKVAEVLIANGFSYEG